MQNIEYYLIKWARHIEPKYLYYYFLLTFRTVRLNLCLCCLINKMNYVGWCCPFKHLRIQGYRMFPLFKYQIQGEKKQNKQHFCSLFLRKMLPSMWNCLFTWTSRNWAGLNADVPSVPCASSRILANIT